VAPCGGSFSNVDLTRFAASSASSDGGRRKTSFAAVEGRNVLPAFEGSGAPARPTTAMLLPQVFAMTNSLDEVAVGRVLPDHGKRSSTVGPRVDATWSACARTSAVMGTCRKFSSSPETAFSTRSSNWRSNRKLDGTIPPAAPECTPSESTSTLSVPLNVPRNDVVNQS